MPQIFKDSKSKTFFGLGTAALIAGVTVFLLGFMQMPGAQTIEDIILPANDPDKKLMGASFEEIRKDPELYKYARQKGGIAFARNCTRCHGSAGQGQPGVPALNDREWIWGGTFDAIYWTIRHGVRGEDGLTRSTSMPDFSAGPILTEERARELAEFILALDENSDFENGIGEEFTFLCSRCHGPYGGGLRGFGAPSLIDDIWLHGGTVEDITNQILNSQHGVMPAWEGVLQPEVVKALAIYVHSLGGGQ